MRLTSITVGRTINTGNYSSRRFEVSAELESEDDFPGALWELTDNLDYEIDKIKRRNTEREKGTGDDAIPF